MATIFDFNCGGRLERERNLYQGGCHQSKIRRGVGLEKEDFALPPNSKSNMASWIKEQEIVMLAHTNKTSALQAKVRLLHLTHFPVPYVPVFCSYRILTSSVIYY